MGDVNEVKKSKRKTAAAQMLRDVCALRKDLARGLSAAEIRQKHKWSEWKYRARMRKAREMSEREYNPERFYEIFLRYEASYRALQRDGRMVARILLNSMKKRKVKRKVKKGKVKKERSPGMGRMCRLAHAWVAVARQVGEWEDGIVRMAQGLGIIPTQTRREERDGLRETVERFMEASVDENGKEVGPPGDAGDAPEVDSELAEHGAGLSRARGAVGGAGGDNRQRVEEPSDGGAGGARGG